MNGMSLRRVLIFSVTLSVSAGLVWGLALARLNPNWRNIGVTFTGFTNSVSGQAAIISFRNRGPLNIELRYYYLEYMGIPSPNGLIGSTNLTRRFSVRPLVIRPSQTGMLMIPVPAKGSRWISTLQFTPTGWITRCAAYVRRLPYPWKWWLPRVFRAVPVCYVRQAFRRELQEVNHTEAPGKRKMK